MDDDMLGIEIKAIWVAISGLKIEVGQLNKRIHRVWQQVENEGT